MLKFELLRTEASARRGRLTLNHGVVETPMFMPVGTTTLRALESAARAGTLQAGAAETDIFITPGFEFRVVDRLVTNFHLPRSTLLMLVSAFAGHAHVRALYAHAVRERYRFFSYGDAMLLARSRG